MEMMILCRFLSRYFLFPFIIFNIKIVYECYSKNLLFASVNFNKKKETILPLGCINLKKNIENLLMHSSLIFLKTVIDKRKKKKERRSLS
jgi:hypothetical protein